MGCLSLDLMFLDSLKTLKMMNWWSDGISLGLLCPFLEHMLIMIAREENLTYLLKRFIRPLKKVSTSDTEFCHICKRILNHCFRYTCFFKSHITGEPLMKPIWYEFPHSSSANSIEDEFLFGSSMLIKPVSQFEMKE